MGKFVARRGLEDIPRAMSCLRELTLRFSPEFAIRPFIDQHPDIVFPFLDRWTLDKSAHVRRLVSEGSRPKLPWGLRLQALVRDPSPTLPLLRKLQDDESSYVRRSVANHLNDIAKDHPDQVATWVRTHLDGASDNRVQLLRHTTRHLIKQGHAPMLSAWSLDAGFTGKVKLRIEKKEVHVGASLPFVVEFKSSSTTEQKLVIDYAIYYRKANGALAAKIFKGWKLTLASGDKRTLSKSHSFKVVTTRTLYPGTHRIEVQVNGQRFAGPNFELLPAAE